mgnify:CR=1 FL=1
MESLTLDNGLRIVVDHRPGQVVYCGLAVDAGTRHQTDAEPGMAHFVEHASFKGTERRRAWHILNRMEAVGGELNAYTGKEHTVYYCACLRQHLRRALDLLFDITLHSTYPQQELEREVEVVIDEIESYNDSPSELIYDDFEALLFPDHPLGRNILGDAERLHQYTSADLQAFTRRLYCPSRAVLFVQGQVMPEQVKRLVEKGMEAHSRTPQEGAKPTPSPSLGRGDIQAKVKHERAPLPKEGLGMGFQGLLREASLIVRHKPVHQAHVMLGTTAYPFTHPDYMAQALLNNILGGPGLNSRLALSLRERRGLVYTVESNLTAYTDTSVWSVYLGCDPSDVNRCLRLVQKELARLADAPLSDRTLNAAKRQMKGQLGVSYDNFENVAIGAAKRYLHYGSAVTPAQLFQQIDAVTAEQLQQVAATLFQPERLTTLVYTN